MGGNECHWIAFVDELYRQSGSSSFCRFGLQSLEVNSQRLSSKFENRAVKNWNFGCYTLANSMHLKRRILWPGLWTGEVHLVNNSRLVWLLLGNRAILVPLFFQKKTTVNQFGIQSLNLWMTIDDNWTINVVHTVYYTVRHGASKHHPGHIIWYYEECYQTLFTAKCLFTFWFANFWIPSISK